MISDILATAVLDMEETRDNSILFNNYDQATKEYINDLILHMTNIRIKLDAPPVEVL